jgi:hypothetical protein
MLGAVVHEVPDEEYCIVVWHYPGDWQWADIFGVALSFGEASKKLSRVKVEDPVSEMELEDDLVDPRYANAEAQ